MTSRTRVAPVTFQVLRARLAGVVQEMQFSLFRTGFSTIIRESQDASCALLDARGRVVAQHVVLPLHIGAFPACTAAVLRDFGDDLCDGDAYLINHPYEGGSPHAPDLFVICPVIVGGELLGFAASMAHKGDIGGPVPGSCSASATETYSEGLHLPAVRYQRAGETNRDIERIIAVNSRTPELVLGDTRGQLGSVRLGERRLREIAARHGLDEIRDYFADVLAVSEQRVRDALRSWPDTVAEAERFVDDDGIDLERSFRLHVTVRKAGDRIEFDFTGSDDQTRGPANIRPPLLRAACAYVVIALLGPDTYVNSGLLDALDLATRPGSVVDPHFPASVNTYNPTVHAVVDAVFDAMSAIVPGRGRADGCASRSFVMSGGREPGTRKYVQYEIFGGGTGALENRDGVSGSSVNHTNGKIAPIEIVESEYTARVTRLELIPDSGGAGRFRGGLGILREYEVVEPARFSLRSTRHKVAPLGVDGGGRGRIGRLTVNPGTPRERVLPSRYSDLPLQPGDTFRLETPGGGGCGDPHDRDPDRVVADVVSGYVSEEAARESYGVVVRRAGKRIVVLDRDATEALRHERTRRSDPGVGSEAEPLSAGHADVDAGTRAEGLRASASGGRLAGKIAVVTGGGRNVGEAIVLRFAREGAKVAVVDLDEDRVRSTVALVEQEVPGAAMAFVCDVSDRASVEDMACAVVGAFGGVDVLVNNVAITDRGATVLDLDEDEWDRVLRVTLTSVFLCTKSVGRRMVETGRGGSIINIGSTSGYRARSNATAYPAAKAAVINLTRSIAAQLAPYGIRANSVTPNKVGSPVGQDVEPEDRKRRNLVGRGGRPDDIAAAVLFLASAESGFIDATDLLVDGGVLHGPMS